MIDLRTGKFDIVISGGLTRYLIPGIGIVDVKSELHVVPGPGGKGTRVTGRGQAWVRRLDNAFLKNLAGGGNADPIARGFEILAAVAQPDSTRWSIVYDLGHLRELRLAANERGHQLRQVVRRRCQ